MDPNTRVLIGLGASVAANCAPCFDQYYAKAVELRIPLEDIKAAVGIGGQMKTGGNLAMIRRVEEVMGGKGQGGAPGCGQAGSGAGTAKPPCCG